MPTTYVKKLAEEHNVPVSEVETKWAKAKKSAAKQGHADDYAYITGILKKMMHEAKTASAQQQTMARLKATDSL